MLTFQLTSPSYFLPKSIQESPTPVPLAITLRIMVAYSPVGSPYSTLHLIPRYLSPSKPITRICGPCYCSVGMKSVNIRDYGRSYNLDEAILHNWLSILLVWQIQSINTPKPLRRCLSVIFKDLTLSRFCRSFLYSHTKAQNHIILLYS